MQYKMGKEASRRWDYMAWEKKIGQLKFCLLALDRRMTRFWPFGKRRSAYFSSASHIFDASRIYESDCAKIFMEFLRKKKMEIPISIFLLWKKKNLQKFLWAFFVVMQMSFASTDLLWLFDYLKVNSVFKQFRKSSMIKCLSMAIHH